MVFRKTAVETFFWLISIYKKFNKTSYYITAMDQNTIFLFEVNLQEKNSHYLALKTRTNVNHNNIHVKEK